MILQRGTLKVGNILVAGTAYGRVRLFQNSAGKKLDSALPSEPVFFLFLLIFFLFFFFPRKKKKKKKNSRLKYLDGKRFHKLVTS